MTFQEADELMKAGIVMRCKRWHPSRFMKLVNNVYWFCSKKGIPFHSDFVLDDEMEPYKQTEWERSTS